ncbi:MAG: hypothetical protein K8W52_28965 [Deltaproteobacteria bacterium]|nr:hypothetical protein [Deltaproteobacteria bacterium]
MMDTEGAPLRLRAGALRLIATAIGGPAQVRGKLRRVIQTAGLYLRKDEIPRRLAVLHDRGYVEHAPTRAQLLFGGLDMVRWVIEPAARDYYQAKGISFGMHTLLRVLDDPVSMIDPTGFLSARDTIIGHVMQVTHLNPIYDLQLLEAFPDGIDELERQVVAVMDGSHPRTRTLAAIVEDPGYHARLLGYVRAFKADRGAPPPVRAEQTLRTDPVFAAAERTFATLPGFLRYCTKLPTGPAALVRRLATVDRFPVELAE